MGWKKITILLIVAITLLGCTGKKVVQGDGILFADVKADTIK